MNQEVYSCLKILETFNHRLFNMLNVNRVFSAEEFRLQYNSIRNILSTHLKENIKFIPEVNVRALYNDVDYQGLMQELIMSSETSIAYLSSINMTLDKELIQKKMEVSEKQKELERKSKEIESMRKLLQDSLKTINLMPELVRSKIVEETKKSHREIEKNTNSKTRSQQTFRNNKN